MIDLGDQIIDAFGGVLTGLVHLQNLIVERPDAGITPLQVSA